MREGEIIYADDQGTICRCWNWRETARTMLTPETTSAVIVIEANDESEYAHLEEAIHLTELLVKKFASATGTHLEFLSCNASSVEF